MVLRWPAHRWGRPVGVQWLVALTCYAVIFRPAVGYVPKAKNAVPNIFSRTEAIVRANETIVIAKFGILSGDQWDLHNLARASGTVVTECNADVYLGPIDCPGSRAALESRDGVFRTTLFGTPFTVRFHDRGHLAPTPSYFAGPWGGSHECTPSPTVLGQLHCSWPLNAAYQVSEHGFTRVWQSTSAGEAFESIVIATAAVVVFALVVPHSKRVTEQALKGDLDAPMPIAWVTTVMGDVIVALVWSVSTVVARDGVRELVHPSSSTLLDSDGRFFAGSIIYGTLVAASIFTLLSIHARVASVLMRTCYEAALLLGALLLTPVSVAPAFHGLFQACVGAVLVFVAIRDVHWCSNTVRPPAVIVLTTSITVTGIILMLPWSVDCDAIPATMEIPMIACLICQIIALAASSTSRSADPSATPN